MKKLVCMVLTVLMAAGVMAGCSQPAAEKASAEATPSVEQTAAPTPEATATPTPAATPSPEASVGTGEIQTMDYHGLTFEYNDKYALEKNEAEDDDYIIITYAPKGAFANICVSGTILDEEQRDIEIDLFHQAFLQTFVNQMGKTQNKQTNDLEIGGVTAKATTAILNVEDNNSWVNIMAVTVPTQETYVSFLFVMSEGADSVYSDEFMQMIDSIQVA